MKDIANLIAISSLFLYIYGIFSKKNSVMLFCYALGDIVYALSYVLLENYFTAITFILAIVINFILSIFSKKKIKVPYYIYILFELLVVISFVVQYSSAFDYIVLIANLIFVFFACYDNVLLLKYATMMFGILLLVYNLLISFTLGIIIELILTIAITIEIITFYVGNSTKNKRN